MILCSSFLILSYWWLHIDDVKLLLSCSFNLCACVFTRECEVGGVGGEMDHEFLPSFLHLLWTRAAEQPEGCSRKRKWGKRSPQLQIQTSSPKKSSLFRHFLCQHFSGLLCFWNSGTDIWRQKCLCFFSVLWAVRASFILVREFFGLIWSYITFLMQTRDIFGVILEELVYFRLNKVRQLCTIC